jgi:hypothetical protein
VFLVGSVLYGSWLIYLAVTDAWVAPIRLSPDNDRIVALRIERVRQQTERGRLESELIGIDEELKALNLAMTRLSMLSAGYRGARTWSLRVHQQERGALAAESRTLEQQRALLENLHIVHQKLVNRAQSDLAAGIITSTQYEKESLELSQIEVAKKANEREMGKVRAAQRVSEYRGMSLTDSESISNSGSKASASERSPEVLKFDEQQIRIELEIGRMQAECRAAESKRRTSLASLESIKKVEEDLRTRPLYRAMTEKTDLAFVPYSQLSGLRSGDLVFRCTWGVILCEHVGTVKEVVPGEVVTQDPWGELARGQYVVLNMRDNSALNEKVLRVRPKAAKLASNVRLSAN